MIPTLLFRAGASTPRSNSLAARVCVRRHPGERRAQAPADFQVPVPLRPLTRLSPASAGGILRSRLMACFLLLSAADLLLTGWLLGSEGPFFEANPLAAWSLERFGWVGLAGHKILSLLLATGGVVVLARRHPRAARWTLTLGCVTVALVVLYGASLAAVPALREQYQQERAVQVREEARARRLDRWSARRKACAKLRRRLSREVLSGRRTVASAVAELEGLGVHQHPDWRNLAETLHPGESPRAILERELLGQLLADIEEGVPEGQRLLARLWPITFRGWNRGLKRYRVPGPGGPASWPR
jgi:uncharacterized protein DUF5658